ncbi:putative ribonuclease H protein [Glycine soja]
MEGVMEEANSDDENALQDLEEANQQWTLAKSLGLHHDSDQEGRGLKWASIRSLVGKFHVDLLCLQETKKDFLDKTSCQFLWGQSDLDWEWQPAINAAGGLGCIWDNNKFQVDFRCSDKDYIMLGGVWLPQMQRVVVINLYAPCDNFEAKLSKWNQRYISMAGRITLINAVLTALPLFFLSFFRIPAAILQRISAIQRQFLWGGKPDSRKIAWISWSQCCSPKHMGGLGIRDLQSLNKALLFKWKWLMFHQPDQLWTRILISKYNGWRGLAYGPRKQYFSTWWADLRAIFQHQNVVRADNQIRWKLGRGDKFLFWEDPWGDGGVPLKDQFPELFSISSQRDLRVEEVGSWTENGWVWNMVWRRNLFDNEVQLASNFIDHIHQIRVNNNLNDTWVWGAESSGIFSTKSGYQVIKAEMVDEGQYLGFKKLWEIKLPPKALSFVWRLLWDRLPTKDNLIKRQIQVDDDLCPFCHNQPESASHLFFTCGKIMPIWWEYLNWVKEDKVFHCRPLDNFIQHFSSASSKVSNTRRTMWWIAATVSIWRLRNDIIFQNQTLDINRMTDNTLFLLWTWLRGWERNFQIPYYSWSSNMSIAFS